MTILKGQFNDKILHDISRRFIIKCEAINNFKLTLYKQKRCVRELQEGA